MLADSSTAAIASALLVLAQDRQLAARMGLAGRVFAARHYRKEALVRNVDALYGELLQKKKSG